MPIHHASHCAKGIVAVLLATMLQPAIADTGDSAASMFSFNGFGTIGVVRSSESQADFVSNNFQPKGAGFTRRWNVTPDSKIGGQLTAHLTDRLSAVVQVVSQYQYDSTFTPDVEWANLKYQFTPDFSVRVGRIAIPTYLYSDSLNVGYALPNVRIPTEIYAQLPVTTSDGIDTSYRFHGHEVTNTVQAYAGNRDTKIPGGPGSTYDIKHLRGIADTLESGAATLHISYQTLDYSLRTNGLVVPKDPQSLINIGAIYDPGQWFVQGEWIRAPDDAFGLFYGWYAIGGIRIDKFTPYVGYARTYRTDAGSLGFPTYIDQNTSTLGLRWDFMRNTDLKLQYDRARLNGGLNALFVNQQAGFRPDGTVNVFSLAVDFVF